MFEGQLAYYLNRYLGSYVYGLDPQSLKVSVFSGDVVLNNLQLKPSALADLNLPISVKSGLLGRLTIKVIISGLASKQKVAMPRLELYPHLPNKEVL